MSHVRIIGGQWRGRKISLANNPALRPTPDRVRETVFNWLMGRLQDRRVLDAFAGSGVLGLEALSRGAAQVCFWENHRPTAQQLRQQISTMHIDNADVAAVDAVAFLQKKPDGEAFGGVFLDPPFNHGLLAKVCELLAQNHWLADNAWIYLEAEKGLSMDFVPANWSCHRSKTAGDVQYFLYINTTP